MSTVTGKPTKPSKPAGKALKPTTNPSNTTHESQVKISIKVLTINVFFDGTKNNKYNIDSKSSYANQIKKDPKGYESYTNAYSNVAHLYRAAYQQSNRDSRVDIINIYVEGMGTTKYQKDDQRGFALGSGVTGIQNRTDKAFEEIKKAMKSKTNKFAIGRIRINVFGFSRGAATARHFLSKLKGHRNLRKWEININFRVNFVGLFDTVSSFDPRSMEEVGWDTAKHVPMPPPFTVINAFRDNKHLPEFNDDIGELDLTLDTNEYTHPEKVFHICASDEYRTFFSLTNINSARLGRGRVNEKPTGFGYEIYLPGAHSDIGGGYPDGIREEYIIPSTDTVLNDWLINQGFYTKKERIPEIEPKVHFDTYTFRRERIPNDAYKIALKVMYEMATQQGGMAGMFDTTYLQDKFHSNHKEIRALVSTIPNEVLKNIGKGWHSHQSPDDFSNYYPNLKLFRNKFVHWSAKKEIGYEVRRGSTTEKNALEDAKQVAADKGATTVAGVSHLLSLKPARVVHLG